VVIANDAKYSYAAKDGTLFITAVRSPVFSHHEPIKLREDAYLRYMDQGPRTFTIRVCGDSEVTRRQAHVMSDNLTKPPLVTTHVTRHGTCPHAGTWLGIDADEHTVVSTIKTAEDTRAFPTNVMRGHRSQLVRWRKFSASKIRPVFPVHQVVCAVPRFRLRRPW
jgi:alpha-mannosidase